ncbi:hypothetical protein BCV70DRAFT_15955 [Testicularia cyperi]|uniref:Uncharacterized protein n=1 Tax=Testicularia cyperi TaxID=1882483 RepID=A0A317XYL2_9BASI|nr:hypothetical protein BCV70DRAFT_15955 [Testicularia cyperi]
MREKREGGRKERSRQGKDQDIYGLRGWRYRQCIERGQWDDVLGSKVWSAVCSVRSTERVRQASRDQLCRAKLSKRPMSRLHSEQTACVERRARRSKCHGARRSTVLQLPATATAQNQQSTSPFAYTHTGRRRAAEQQSAQGSAPPRIGSIRCAGACLSKLRDRRDPVTVDSCHYSAGTEHAHHHGYVGRGFDQAQRRRRACTVEHS